MGAPCILHSAAGESFLKGKSHISPLCLKPPSSFLSYSEENPTRSCVIRCLVSLTPHLLPTPPPGLSFCFSDTDLCSSAWSRMSTTWYIVHRDIIHLCYFVQFFPQMSFQSTVAKYIPSLSSSAALFFSMVFNHSFYLFIVCLSLMWTETLCVLPLPHSQHLVDKCWMQEWMSTQEIGGALWSHLHVHRLMLESRHS